MTIGFRILRRVRKVDAAAAAKFKALPLANVSDVMSRMSAGGAANLLRVISSSGGRRCSGPVAKGQHRVACCARVVPA
jgi:hypothetical protein